MIEGEPRRESESQDGRNTPGRFAARRVPAEAFGELITETLALYRSAPARLFGMFVLLFIPIEILTSLLPYIGMPIREATSEIAFAGYFVALEAARRGRAPTLAQVTSVLKLPADKLVLLAAAGLVPLVFGLLLCALDWGAAPTLDYMSGAVPTLRLPPTQQLELIGASSLLTAPFWFVQPLCVLFPWSASRTFAANLLACAANWRWLLGVTLLLLLVSISLDSLAPQGAFEWILAVIGSMATEIFLLGFTLALMRRAIPDA